MRVWFARFSVALVFLFNLQCAIAFWLRPRAYAPAYELSGDVAVAVMRGFSVLFLMWNVPYVVALLHPWKYRLVLWLAVVMQAVGVVGETLILLDLPAGHDVLCAAIRQFITFDGFGLILLLFAVWITKKS